MQKMYDETPVNGSGGPRLRKTLNCTKLRWIDPSEAKRRISQRLYEIYSYIEVIKLVEIQRWSNETNPQMLSEATRKFDIRHYGKL